MRTCRRAGSLSEVLPDGTAWLDSGTFASLHDASGYVRVIEERQGFKVGCPEQIAWRNRWISDQDMERVAESLHKSGYGEYLASLLGR
jgi:glucose-1-phosphate thymidylyltransferase